MAKLYQRPICLASVLLVPWLTLASPTWLSLSGFGPSWSILWLLPWAIEGGQLSGAIAGLCIGLVLDGLSLGGPTQVPALIFLGFWWGHLGTRGRGPKIEGSLKLGLLAWAGSVVLSLTIWIQVLIINKGAPFDGFNAWGLNTLLSNAIVTGLLAPIVASWLLLLWRRG